MCLWSKTLPNGEWFELDYTHRGKYLYHQSHLGQFFLASDSVIPTFNREARIAQVLNKIPPEMREDFLRISYTIGGMMIFPANRVGRKMTINGARGFHPRIKDRFDLTIECIRRYYIDKKSPLSDPLNRYKDFFSLFGDFRGYIEFFLLQDLVNTEYSSVNFFMRFENFTTSPLPQTVKEYEEYRQLSIDFIEARGRRMLEFCSAARHGTQ